MYVGELTTFITHFKNLTVIETLEPSAISIPIIDRSLALGQANDNPKMTRPIITLKPSYNSMIRGCPGVPSTLPRIECQLRIRSSNSKPLLLNSAEIILKTIESLHASTAYLYTPHFGSNGSKHETVDVLYRKKVALNSNVRSQHAIMGIDLPLTIALPDDIKETNYHSRFGQTITYLECNVSYQIASNSEHLSRGFKTPVNIRRYNCIPDKVQPISKSVISPDKKVNIIYHIHNPHVFADDIINVTIDMKPNSRDPYKTMPSVSQTTSTSKLFGKRCKWKAVTIELREVLETLDSNEIKENVLATLTKTVNEEVNINTIKCTLSLPVCNMNEDFRDFDHTMQEPEIIYKLPSSDIRSQVPVPTKLIQNKQPEIPFQYHTSVSRLGKLFSVSHSIFLRFKMGGHGKSFEISHPIVCSGWPISHTKFLEQIVDQEMETALHAKRFYENFGGIKRNPKHTDILEYPLLPPIVYEPDDIETMREFGLETLSDAKNRSRKVPVIE